jgi:acetyl-CoA carboxylase carboxyltransferase component
LIYFKEDTVISAITVQNATGNSLAGETFVADTKLSGIVTSITLTSGACLAYRV